MIFSRSFINFSD